MSSNDLIHRFQFQYQFLINEEVGPKLSDNLFFIYNVYRNFFLAKKTSRVKFYCKRILIHRFNEA